MTERDIFIGALREPGPEARADFLDRACGDDRDARERVESMLREHDRLGSFLEPAKDPNATASVSASAAEALGTLIGAYKLLQQLGEGGMGTVYMAEQTEPVRRKVALKVLKPGMDTRQVVARFEAERQALAIMDHPNIARVFDGGATPSGRPYFVMELVTGVPITDFCDQIHLAPRERLELFVVVCQAVQHAHQKGIIHRDLKPSNILVSRHDTTPVVKVIDFGVAKALGQSLTDKTLFTGVAQMVGTPLYMSPEQAGMSDLDVDTRSDIYSLGVLLYELLTGSTPFTRERFKQAAYDEIRRIIREEDPPKPSTRLSDSKDSLPSISAQRHTEPAKLTKLVRGELDWLVMKALEKDRSRRYETANGFAADVQRYLAGEAVQAVPPSAGYRLRKFVRRNKGPVLAASLVLFMLVAGVAGTTLGLVRAEQQRRRAERSAEAQRLATIAAEAKEAEANAVVIFFRDKVFSAGRPKNQDGGLGSEVSLRDAVVASLPALNTAFVQQPLVEARLRDTLGLTFAHLGQAERACEQIERARELFTRHRGHEDSATLGTMNNLANCYEYLNRIQDALKLREETLVIRKRVLPPDHPDTLQSMCSLANSYAALNRPADALKLREETLAIQKRVLPTDHPDTLSSMNNLALSYAALNRPADALKLREETLAIRKRGGLPQDHPDTLSSMNNLANSYAALNRPADALKLREETLAIRKRVLPTDHPDTLMSMCNLANSYAALNRHADALKLREETLAIQKRVLPPDHPDTLLSMNNLASSYATLNRPAEALKLFEETLAIRKRGGLPQDHPDTLSSMNNLANSYAALNRPADALKLREETLAIRKRVLPTDHPDTLKSMAALADSLVALDRGAEAIPFLDEFLAKAPGRPSIRPAHILRATSLRLQHFQKVGDPAGCRATAAMWEKLNRPDAESLYNAACYRAVTAAVQAKTPGANSARLANADADKAMELLRQAVKAGWNDVAHMKENDDLKVLHDREDFKKLLNELETKKK